MNRLLQHHWKPPPEVSSGRMGPGLLMSEPDRQNPAMTLRSAAMPGPDRSEPLGFLPKSAGIRWTDRTIPLAHGIRRGATPDHDSGPTNGFGVMLAGSQTTCRSKRPNRPGASNSPMDPLRIDPPGKIPPMRTIRQPGCDWPASAQNCSTGLRCCRRWPNGASASEEPGWPDWPSGWWWLAIGLWRLGSWSPTGISGGTARRCR